MQARRGARAGRADPPLGLEAGPNRKLDHGRGGQFEIGGRLEVLVFEANGNRRRNAVRVLGDAIRMGMPVQQGLEDSLSGAAFTVVVMVGGRPVAIGVMLMGNQLRQARYRVGDRQQEKRETCPASHGRAL